MVKLATLTAADELAKQYALYQIGLLFANTKDTDAPFLKEMAVRSNYVV